ncbi:MAG: hypothetical protein K6253_01860, partial [Candidatus Liberibacter asiaticus]|nr:hypothetical protein [Candidatus Liberibacter asiaticus]
ESNGFVSVNSETETLKSWVLKNPNVLGEKVVQKWGADIPFLFKVISISISSSSSSLFYFFNLRISLAFDRIFLLDEWIFFFGQSFLSRSVLFVCRCFQCQRHCQYRLTRIKNWPRLCI